MKLAAGDAVTLLEGDVIGEWKRKVDRRAKKVRMSRGGGGGRKGRGTGRDGKDPNTGPKYRGPQV